ncbi:Protease [Balamuthia mandrillaris]
MLRNLTHGNRRNNHNNSNNHCCATSGQQSRKEHPFNPWALWINRKGQAMEYKQFSQEVRQMGQDFNPYVAGLTPIQYRRMTLTDVFRKKGSLDTEEFSKWLSALADLLNVQEMVMRENYNRYSTFEETWRTQQQLVDELLQQGVRSVLDQTNAWFIRCCGSGGGGDGGGGGGSGGGGSSAAFSSPEEDSSSSDSNEGDDDDEEVSRSTKASMGMTKGDYPGLQRDLEISGYARPLRTTVDDVEWEQVQLPKELARLGQHSMPNSHNKRRATRHHRHLLTHDTNDHESNNEEAQEEDPYHHHHYNNDNNNNNNNNNCNNCQDLHNLLMMEPKQRLRGPCIGILDFSQEGNDQIDTGFRKAKRRKTGAAAVTSSTCGEDGGGGSAVVAVTRVGNEEKDGLQQSTTTTRQTNDQSRTTTLKSRRRRNKHSSSQQRRRRLRQGQQSKRAAVQRKTTQKECAVVEEEDEDEDSNDDVVIISRTAEDDFVDPLLVL